MRHKLAALLTTVILLSVATAASSEGISVGVKSGDWIEYNVTSSGAPMQGHDVEWARMEVIAAQSPNITVTLTSRFTDGITDTITATINLETGHLIDDFIIPANLNVGDSFKDEHYGSITITGSQERTYVGVQRTVLYATMGNNTYYWDKATGVSVEGNTQTPEYAIHSVASATNMWRAESGLVFDFASLVLVGGVIVVVLSAFVAWLVHYLRRRTCNAKRR